MTTKPLLWIVASVIAVLSATFAYSFFSKVFPIIDLDISMTREAALMDARQLAADKNWGPSNPESAVSFSVDRRAQTFIELEAGGVESFRALLNDEIYTPYSWRVRLFTEGEVNEVNIYYRPNGRLLGFAERIPEDAERPNIDSKNARALAEQSARDFWAIDLMSYRLVESGQDEKPNGRIDHRFVYEHSIQSVGEASQRVEMDVSGDRVSRIVPILRVPESFYRRFEEMRSANNSLAMAGSTGAILYFLVGCGFGFFYLLRRHALAWRHPVILAVVIASLQILNGLNALPLTWLNYNTSLTSESFLLTALLPILLNGVFMGVVLSFSFIAAEGLSRLAFPRHPQLWKVWDKEAASTYEITSQTANGYLLLPIMLAFVVGFHYIASKYWGWWNPADTMANPDALAHILPWLTPLALSLQAGVWEECLFRAVPLAGAALLGERFGKRSLFISIMVLLQALIFASAHANYPAQPAYARLVELILPSIIFALLYLRFGLLPAIVLHILYDLVLFSIPVFAAEGVWGNKAILVVLMLSPALIILLRRWQTGSLSVFDTSLRNNAWQVKTPTPIADHPKSSRINVWPRWLLPALTVVSIVIVPASIWSNLQHQLDIPTLQLTSDEALNIARKELVNRSVKLPAETKELVSVLGSPAIADSFLWQTAGREVYESMVGNWLHAPRYRIRFSRFEGDVAERADEWVVTVVGSGQVNSILHKLAEGAPGANLTEAQARTLAFEALERELDIQATQVREVSVTPQKQPARTDWTFTFSDTNQDSLPLGERRVSVQLAGDETVLAIPFIYVPEEWTREQQSKIAILIIGTLSSLSLGGLLLAGAITGIVAWSRGTFAVRYCLTTGLVGLVIGASVITNQSPSSISGFSTAQPFGTQITTMVVSDMLMIIAISAGLALNAGLVSTWRQPRVEISRNALIVAGILIALVASSLTFFTNSLETATPEWPDTFGADSMFPIIASALITSVGFIGNTLVFLLVFGFIDRMTIGWTRRQVLGLILLFVFGAITIAPTSSGIFSSWAISAAVTAITIVTIYYLVARHDLAVVPIITATNTIIYAIPVGDEAYPSAMLGSGLTILLVAGLAWWSFLALWNINHHNTQHPL